MSFVPCVAHRITGDAEDWSVRCTNEQPVGIVQRCEALDAFVRYMVLSCVVYEKFEVGADRFEGAVNERMLASETVLLGGVVVGSCPVSVSLVIDAVYCVFGVNTVVGIWNM